MKKIKIAHILHSVGGVDVHLRLLIGNLNPEKFQNIVIHGKTDAELEFLDKNNQAVKTFQTSIDRNISAKNDLTAFAEIKKIIQKEQPNLLHGHSAKGGIFAKLVGKKQKIPTLHTPHAYSYLSAENKMKRNTYLRLERSFKAWNNKILACSVSEQNRAIKDVGYKPEKVLLFNNAIEPINNIPKLSIKKTWPKEYICSVGRPSYQKNIEFMLQVLKAVKAERPNIHLVLMGVGFHAPNLENVKKQIIENQLEANITLLEWTKREDIFNIIKNSKLYISTARYEGLPYSVIEALALQKACVVTNVDGNRDLVVNEINGYVIANEDTIDFKDKILKLLSDTELRKQFETNSFSKFNQHFNIKNTIEKLEKIYIENAKI